MKSGRVANRCALLAGCGALVVMGVFTAGCGTETKEQPSTPPTPTSAGTPAPSSPATPSPTEKAVGPGGNNSFSPTVNPLPPGSSCARIVNGVCQR